MGSDSTQVQDVIVGVALVTVDPPPDPDAPTPTPPVPPPTPTRASADATIETTGADPPPEREDGSDLPWARRSDAQRA